MMCIMCITLWDNVIFLVPFTKYNTLMSEAISPKRKFPLVVQFAALIIVLGGIMYAEAIVNQFLMALFISIISVKPILWLQNKKIPQGVAIAMVVSFIILVFIGLGQIIGSSVSSFSEDAPKYEENLDKATASAEVYLASRGIDLSGTNLSSVLNPSKIMKFTTNVLKQLGGFMGNFLTILFLVLFLLLELDSFVIKGKAIAESTQVTMGYLKTIAESIRNYLSIKTMTSLLTGFIIWVALLIIGVDYAIIWALIVFLLNYIPNFGSIIAAIPAVLFALIQLGVGGAVWTMLVYIAVNTLIGNIVEPKIMGNGLGLSTFVIFVSLIFWGFILGTVGMFLSVPLTMAIKIILEQNPSTHWLAVILGTDDDAKRLLKDSTAEE